MKPFKPPSQLAEDELNLLTKKDPTIKPTVPIQMKPAKAKPPPPPPPAPAAVTDLETVIVQLQNIWEKVVAIELIVTAQFKTPVKVVDDTHPAPAYPETS